MTADLGDVQYDKPILVGDLMPLQKVTIGGNPCWRFGDSGKPYPFNPDDPESEKEAKKKAIAQGLAMGDGELKKAAVNLLLEEITKCSSHSREYLDAFHAAVMAHKDIDPAHKDAAHKTARAGAGGKLRGRGSPLPQDEGSAEQDALDPGEEQDLEEIKPVTKSWQVPIIKAEQMIVYGVVSEPHTIDLQGDRLSPEEIEKAAHSFMVRSRKINQRHSGPAQADVLESFIAPGNFEVNGQPVQKGSWVMAVRVNDQSLWQAVKRHEITGFSIGGRGSRTPFLSA